MCIPATVCIFPFCFSFIPPPTLSMFNISPEIGLRGEMYQFVICLFALTSYTILKRERDRETDRQIDRETERDREKQRDRKSEKETERQR